MAIYQVKVTVGERIPVGRVCLCVWEGPSVDSVRSYLPKVDDGHANENPHIKDVHDSSAKELGTGDWELGI